eukprot:2892039-Rhodomonas_salina.2
MSSAAKANMYPGISYCPLKNGAGRHLIWKSFDPEQIVITPSTSERIFRKKLLGEASSRALPPEAVAGIDLPGTNCDFGTRIPEPGCYFDCAVRPADDGAVQVECRAVGFA